MWVLPSSKLCSLVYHNQHFRRTCHKDGGRSFLWNIGKVLPHSYHHENLKSPTRLDNGHVFLILNLGRIWPWPNSRYHLKICLEYWGKAWILWQQCPNQNPNNVPPKCKWDILLLHLNCSVSYIQYLKVLLPYTGKQPLEASFLLLPHIFGWLIFQKVCETNATAVWLLR
jgi:hypothetical protein